MQTSAGPTAAVKSSLGAQAESRCRSAPAHRVRLSLHSCFPGTLSCAVDSSAPAHAGWWCYVACYAAAMKQNSWACNSVSCDDSDNSCWLLQQTESAVWYMPCATALLARRKVCWSSHHTVTLPYCSAVVSWVLQVRHLLDSTDGCILQVPKAPLHDKVKGPSAGPGHYHTPVDTIGVQVCSAAALRLLILVGCKTEPTVRVLAGQRHWTAASHGTCFVSGSTVLSQQQQLLRQRQHLQAFELAVLVVAHLTTSSTLAALQSSATGYFMIHVCTPAAAGVAACALTCLQAGLFTALL